MRFKSIAEISETDKHKTPINKACGDGQTFEHLNIKIDDKN